MRILVLHNATLLQGGGEVSVANEVRMLQNAGLYVRLLIKENSKLTLYEKGKLFISPAFSRKSFEEVSKTISSFRPTLIHIHNFTPQWTWAAFKASINCEIPVIHTMHTYGLICPANLLLKSNGKTCNNCVSSSKYKSLLNKCKTSSFLMKIMNARSMSSGIAKSIADNDFFTIISLTNFARNLLLKDGFKEKAVLVKPHFTDSNPFPSTPNRSNKILYIGRLGFEKGIEHIIREFFKIKHLALQLRIIGDGPLKHKLKSLVESLDLTKQVQFLGYQSPDVCKKELASSMCLVMNSLTYESFGLVAIEAFAASVPVIAPDFGSMRSIIRNGFNGFLLDPIARDIANKIQILNSQPYLCAQMGKNARVSYERNYTPQRNISRLLGCYKYAIQKADKPIPPKLAEIETENPFDDIINRY